MRLLMCFSEGDHTYCVERVLPIEFESAEAAIINFEAACMTAVRENDWRVDGDEFIFCGHSLNTAEFWFLDYAYGQPEKSAQPKKFYPPDFFTIDEFFAQRLGTEVA